MKPDIDVVIRDAVREDLPVVLELNEVVQSLHVTACPDVFKAVEDTDALLAILTNAVCDDGWGLWVACIDGLVVGCIMTELNSKLETALSLAHIEGHIHHVCVSEHHRRLGVGSQPVDQAIKTLRKAKPQRVTVGYWSFNEASKRLFESRGFKSALVIAELRNAN